MKQHYAVGQYFRKRYIEGQPYKLLSEIYDRHQVSSVVHLMHSLFCFSNIVFFDLLLVYLLILYRVVYCVSYINYIWWN